MIVADTCTLVHTHNGVLKNISEVIVSIVASLVMVSNCKLFLLMNILRKWDAVCTYLRAMTWSSMREMRGETTITTLPLNTAGYW